MISFRALAINGATTCRDGTADRRHYEEIQQQNREAAHEFALLGFAHALDFLGDRLKVGFAGPASAQERRLFEGPGVEIAVVQGASRRHSTKATPALQACRSFRLPHAHDREKTDRAGDRDVITDPGDAAASLEDLRQRRRERGFPRMPPRL